MERDTTQAADIAALPKRQGGSKKGRVIGVPDALLVRIGRAKLESGFSKSTLLRWIAAGKFPAPILRDGNTVLWSYEEIRAWKADLVRRRDERNAQAQSQGAAQ